MGSSIEDTRAMKRSGTQMKSKPLSLKWRGTFIELCMHRVTQTQKDRIDSVLADSANPLDSMWYDNVFLLKSLFGAESWWAVDDLDHSMGFVFSNRSLLDKGLSTIRYTLAGMPVTVDPEALQLSFYAPEAIESQLNATDQILCHGTLKQAHLHLEVDIEPPFDPTLVTLSFLTYPDYGHILIDLDYDGYDDVQFSWGETEYLKPRFFGKDFFNDAAK
jgi:hypothetical protein